MGRVARSEKVSARVVSRCMPGIVDGLMLQKPQTIKVASRNIKHYNFRNVRVCMGGLGTVGD